MSKKCGRVIGIGFDKKPAKKYLFIYTKENFTMYTTWIKEYFTIHSMVFESIGENLENFYKVFDKRFFEWLNQQKNSSKFMFEIKKEFMELADEVLLFQIMTERFKKSENQFVIPVFEENSETNSESDVEIEIDSLPDPEPCYNLMEEKQVPQECLSDNESAKYDDEFYLSFFVKN